MHITGQTAIELNGCGWHSTVLDKVIDVAYEENEIQKVEYFKKHILKGNSQGVKFIPSLSNIFGNNHLIQRKADNYLPFDYLCADCVRAYVELINYLLHKLEGKIKQITSIGKRTFLFPMTDYLFDEKQEEEIFFYLDKLKNTLEDNHLKTLLEELIEYNQKELANV